MKINESCGNACVKKKIHCNLLMLLLFIYKIYSCNYLIISKITKINESCKKKNQVKNESCENKMHKYVKRRCLRIT